MQSENLKAALERRQREDVICMLREARVVPEGTGWTTVLPSGTACKLDVPELADWLVNRSEEIGPAAAIAEWQRFLAEDEVAVQQVAVLYGVEVRSTYTISETVRIVSLRELDESPFIEGFYEKVAPILMMPASVAVVRDVSWPKSNYLTTGPVESFGPNSREIESMRELSLLLATVLRSPVLCGVYWEQPKKWVPAAPQAVYTIPQANFRPLLRRAKRIGEAHCATLVRLFEMFSVLDGDVKQGLRIPLDRVNRAMLQSETVDSAIELGIALESFFLHDEQINEQINLTIRMRAARYLGTSQIERQRIARLVGNLYTLRSEAVHRGSFTPKSSRKLNPKGCLRQGVRILSRALRKVIGEGRMPDWNRILYE